MCVYVFACVAAILRGQWGLRSLQAGDSVGPSCAPANLLNCEGRWRRLWGCEVAWGRSRRSLVLSLGLDPANKNAPPALCIPTVWSFFTLSDMIPVFPSFPFIFSRKHDLASGSERRSSGLCWLEYLHC